MMAFCVEPTGSGHDKSPVPLRTNEALAADTSIASGLGKYKENRHRAVFLKGGRRAREQGHNLLPSSHEGLSIQNPLGIRRIESWTSYVFWDAEEAIDSSMEKEIEESVG